jgi:hypothetical protein
MKRTIFHKSPGQVAILYALALTTLAGVIAMGADVAIMYVNWQQTQKVADAAAVAGSNYLTGTVYTGTVDPTCTGQPDSASQVACTYAVKNGLAASTLTITEPGKTPPTIKVVATNSGLPYFFAKSLPVKKGDSPLSTYTVAASATSAGGGTVTTVNASISNGTNLGLMPLGLQCATPCPAGSFVAGQSVSFGQKFISATINLAGNWGWLDLDGSGGSGLKNDLANGASTPYSAINPDGTCSGPGSCTVYTNPGGKVGPINQGLTARFKGCPAIADPCTGGNPTSIPAGDPCLVVVPVVDFAAAAKAGKTNLTIETFAEVYLDPTTTDGTHINGCYVSAVVGNSLASTTTTTTTTTEFVGATAPPTLTN